MSALRLLFCAVLSVPFLTAAENTQIDGNPTLFSVMVALNAAGVDTTAGSPVTRDLRRAVLDHVESKKPAVLPQLRNYFESHRKPDNVAQYVSFALSVTEPPALESRFRTGDIPPEVAALEGLAPLLARFHREAEIDSLWKQVQPALEQVLGYSHPAVVQAIADANGYTRSFTSGYMGRTFSVYVDLLGAPGKTHSRNFGDEYFLVIAPAQQPPAADIRHAYLHYLIDPLPYKFSAVVNKKRGLVDYAEMAPLLDSSYKTDFLLLTTESLIKAIESRLSPSNEARTIIGTALAEGYVLTPALAELLPSYEKQEAAMRLYFPDLINAIDVKKEGTRLEAVTFASKRNVPSAPAALALSPAEESIEKAEELSAGKQYDAAREVFLKVLETPEKALHARAYFGLARIAAFQKNPELAEKLFQKTLELNPDAGTRSWSDFYLGRLSELAGDRDAAIRYYQSVLANNDASPAARREAEKALSASKQN